MSSTLKRTALLLLLAAILVVAWIANRGSRAPGVGAGVGEEKRAPSGASEAGLDSQVKPEDGVVREAEGEMPKPEPHAAATSISIRSSAGLKLAFVEIQERDAPWQRRDLVEGRCELEGAALPCRLRAPGHSPAAVERLGGAIVLEPDALLVLETPGLRGCVESIEALRYGVAPRNPKFPERLGGFSSSGYLDDDHWAIAVTSKQLATFSTDRKLPVTLEWHDRRRAEIVFEALPGARAIWNPTCSNDVEVAPLDVTLLWPEGEKAGEAVLYLWRIHETGARDGTRLDLPWGTVEISPASRVFIETRVKPGSGSVPLGPLPRGARCVFMAIDHASGAYGGMIFEHNGSARTLSMQKGLAIIGRLSVPAGVPSPTRTRFSWEYLASDQDRYPWVGSQRDVATGADGEFEVRRLDHFPFEQTASLDPPHILDLTVVAPGFEDFHRTYSTGGARRFDCGVLNLKPIVPQMVLAPGFQIEERSLDYQHLRVSARPDIAWEVRNCLRELDGSLAIFLRREEGGEPGKERYHFWSDESGKDEYEPFPEAPGDFALLDPGEVGVGLRRRSDGRYESVATRSCTLDVDCRSMPSNGGPWSLGWRWQGLWIGSSRITPEFEGERTRIELPIPEDEVTLWWSGSGMPPDEGPGAAGEGGTIPATGSLLHLTLP
jgi:hypothetical protein